MKSLYILLITILSISIVTFSSCKTPKEIDALTDEDIKFKMSKGGCFGKCPIYTIEIYEGGYTKFYGDRHSDKLGIFDKTISQETFKMLVSEFEKANFYEFKDKYESMIPDAPSVTITYQSKKLAKKTVVGKLERPNELKELQVLLENVASSDGWNLLEKPKEIEKEEKKEEKKTMIKTEIIIEPKPNVAMSKWFSEKKELYGVRIIKKIAPNLNLWLITYDTKKVDGDMMMQILQNDPSIQNAEFNARTTLRGGGR